MIRWPVRVKIWKGKPTNNATLRQHDPIFWQYFVFGAPAYCTYNINVDKNIANGTEMICHSITPYDIHQKNQIIRFFSMSSYGDILSLDTSPQSVNFEIPGSNLNPQLLEAAITFHPETGNIIIPIIFDKKNVSNDWFIVRGGSPYKCMPSKVYIQSHFPFDLGFSMTIHKAQGRTLKKVILSISEHPNYICRLSWSAIYVALSRIKDRNDIRFLIKKLNGQLQYNTLEYVTVLHRKKDVALYFAGFRHKNGARWKPLDAFDSPYLC